MAYDGARCATIFFGGRDTNKVALEDTWQFDGRGWDPARARSPPFRTPRSCDDL